MPNYWGKGSFKAFHQLKRMEKELAMPFLYITIMITGLDQLVKWVIQTKMTPYQSIDLFWNGLVSITYAKNPGAAFSIMQSYPVLLAFIAAGVFLLVWLNRRLLLDYPRIFQVGVAVALGGALGNFIDRVRLGYVVDFMAVYIWPVFNVADAAIVCGVGLIILGLIRQNTAQKPKPVQPDDIQAREGSHDTL
jgi:signal peptidase II